MIISLDIYQFLKVTVPFFLSLLFIAEYIRTKNREFLYIFIVFLLFLLKELFYIYIGIDRIFEEVVQRGTVRVKVFKNPSLYYLRYFLWHMFENVFTIALGYSFLHWVDSLRKSTEMIVNLIIYLFNLLLTLGLLVYVLIFTTVSPSLLALKIDSTEVSFANTTVELLVTSLHPVYGWWKIVLLIYPIVVVARIYGFVAERLPHLYFNKGWAVVVMGLFSLVYFFSGIGVYIPQYKGYYIFQILALLIYVYFSYKVFSFNILDLEIRIEDLEKERDIVISLMQEIASTLSEEINMEIALSKIVDAAVEGTHSKAGAIFLKDKTGQYLSVKYVKGLFPPLRPLKLDTSAVIKEKNLLEIFKSEKVKIGETYIGAVAESKEPLFIKNAMEDSRIIQTAKGIVDIKSVIAVPLKLQEEILGVLAVINKANKESHDDSDFSLLQTLADQAAITIRQFQMYQEILEKKQSERELSIAHEIQQSLLPSKFPNTDKFEMYGFSIPAKGVGGDYFDYIQFAPNKLGIFIADVSGKGVPAALIMVMIRSILRTLASLDKETKIVVEQLNNSLSGDIAEDRYATAFYVVMDAERRILNYTNAGHGPMLVYRAKTKEFELLDTQGMPIGIMPDLEYGQDFKIMDPGDIGVLYTDGITEAMDWEHNQFTLERLQDVIYKNKDLDAKSLAQAVLKEVEAFCKGAPQHDDETLIVIKFK